jgi:hypothetical protein
MADDSIKGTRWSKLPSASKYDLAEAGKDVRATAKSLNIPENLKGAAIDAVKKAGIRGASRLAGAAGQAAGAAALGYGVGRELDEGTGVGKAMVNKSGLGDLAEKVAKPDEKVELSQSAKDRIARGDLDKKPSKPTPKKSVPDDTRAGSSPDDDIGKPKEPSGEAMRKGGKVRSSASKRGDGIATKGHTKGRYM